jgi:predicted lipase
MAIDTKEEYMLTTIDNPWNPWNNWDEWRAYDEGKGYHTLSYLARVSVFSFDLSEADQDLAVDQAIDEIVKLNLDGRYIKITKEGKREV